MNFCQGAFGAIDTMRKLNASRNSWAYPKCIKGFLCVSRTHHRKFMLIPSPSRDSFSNSGLIKGILRLSQAHQRNSMLIPYFSKERMRRFPKGDRKALWGVRLSSPVATKRKPNESAETSGPRPRRLRLRTPPAGAKSLMSKAEIKKALIPFGRARRREISAFG